MFAVTPMEVTLFLQQLGLAVAGAAALWGFIFVCKGIANHHGDTCIIFDWLAQRLLLLFYGGFALSIFSWIALGFVMPVFAHEGIVLDPTIAERVAAYEMTIPFFIAWLLIVPLGLLIRHVTPHQFHNRLRTFFAINFLFSLFLISIPAITGELSARQFFFFGHSAHSILTLGTVVVLDFLFLISKSSLHLKQHIYPMFPTITKVVLLGLALEFVSVLLVFESAIALTPVFFFQQTVIGILLINGIILAGPLTRRMIAAADRGDGRVAARWDIVGDVAGTVSIGSWFAITAIDYFKHITISYEALMGIYALVLLAAITGHLLWSRFFGTEDDVPVHLREWHKPVS